MKTAEAIEPAWAHRSKRTARGRRRERAEDLASAARAVTPPGRAQAGPPGRGATTAVGPAKEKVKIRRGATRARASAGVHGRDAPAPLSHLHEPTLIPSLFREVGDFLSVVVQHGEVELGEG